MKVILYEDVHKLGSAGDIKEVAAGFARNYLVPQKLAFSATPANIKRWESEKRVRDIRLSQTLDQAKKTAEQMEQASLDLIVKAGREGHLFGSVTSQMIADALLAKGFSIDRRHILLDHPIKALGAHKVPVKVHSQVTANLKVNVQSETPIEAAAQTHEETAPEAVSESASEQAEPVSENQ